MEGYIYKQLCCDPMKEGKRERKTDREREEGERQGQREVGRRESEGGRKGETETKDEWILNY